MSSPPPQQDAGPSTEWYCHACSVTTREPIREPVSGALQCPACRSDFLEQLDAADDPRRLSDWPEELVPQQQPIPLGGGGNNPFAAMLSQVLGGAQQRHQQRAAQRQDSEPEQDQGPEAEPQPRQEAHGPAPVGGVTFTFMTSGVDQDGNRVTTTHAGPQQPPPTSDDDHHHDHQRQQPQSLTDFLNQAFQGNPNANRDPSDPQPQPRTQQQQQQQLRGEGQQQRPTPTSLAGLLGAMLGGQGGPALVQQGPGGMQFIFNSTFGPMNMGGDEPPMQWGDALNERGLDNFITALMNQAQANQEGPRRAPEEMINSLPRKHLSADDIASFRHAECAICKDDFHPDDDVITLECDHVFHADCIVPWLERSGTCAVCRHELVEQPGSQRPQQQQQQQPPPSASQPPRDPEPHSEASSDPAADSPDASSPREPGHDHGQPHFHVHAAGGGGGGPMPPVFSLIGDLFGQIFPGQQFPGQQQPQQHSGQQQQQQAQQQSTEQQSRQEREDEHPPEQEPLD